MKHAPRLRTATLAGIVAVSLSCSGSAISEPAKVQSKLQSAYPGVPIESVKSTPIKGVFEVNLAGRMVYSDASGRYFLFGRLHDMQSDSVQTTASPTAERTDYPVAATPQALAELSRLADRNAIKVVKGSGAATLYLFTDPKCPYCRPAETELEKLDNVTIYKFMFPVVSEESRILSTKVWCSKDRAGQWAKVMAGGRISASTGCDTPLDANIALGQALGIRGTPTMLNNHGQMAVGFQAADSVARLITTAGVSK